MKNIKCFYKITGLILVTDHIAYLKIFIRPYQAFKQASRPYQAFIRPDSGLKSRPMTDRKSDLGFKKIWQAKLRPCKV
ncbi:hypothetical protein MTR_3g111030 [Medicago truncatula]|uniref:Uncharacterized protein n=1 Tax=Medicago truncatula TaxID=3880 RepID=G7J428_MEDTR|nr:hypothetical protein MTR_3g111030 [Medicago truncatula]